jgi:indolepyruvate ferredoxin oxidoreductase beta subunit
MASRMSFNQQIVVSGVGGQGVLFATGVLAQAAMHRNLPVFTSETHGMAQRGGTVISHLKVGTFSSPLIRRGQADGLIAFKAENIGQHGVFVKPGGWLIVNDDSPAEALPSKALGFDATATAHAIGQPRSVNLILIGFALARLTGLSAASGALYFSRADIEHVLKRRFASRPPLLEDMLTAVKTGFDAVND